MLGDRTAIFLTCSKFDGARNARGVCLTHLGDSTAYVWRTQIVNEDPRAYVAYLPRISYFFRTPCQRSSIEGEWNRGMTWIQRLIKHPLTDTYVEICKHITNDKFDYLRHQLCTCSFCRRIICFVLVIKFNINSVLISAIRNITHKANAKFTQNNMYVLSLKNHNTVKPVYNDHLIGYFSAFWSSRRQKSLARVNRYLQSSSKHLTE